MAVPILVFQNIVNIILVVGLQAKCAEFAFAFVVDAARSWAATLLAWLGAAKSTCLWYVWIQALIQVWKENLRIAGQLLFAKGTQIVQVDVQILHPSHELIIILREGIDVYSKLSGSVVLALNLFPHQWLHLILGCLNRLIFDFEILLDRLNEPSNLRPILKVNIMNLDIVDHVALRFIWIRLIHISIHFVLVLGRVFTWD